MHSRSPKAAERSSSSRSERARWRKTRMRSPRTSSSTSSNGPPGPVSCASTSRIASGSSELLDQRVELRARGGGVRAYEQPAQPERARGGDVRREVVDEERARRLDAEPPE